MTIRTEKISENTAGFCDIIDLTAKTRALLTESQLQHGTCTLFVSGSTAALTTIEHEPGVEVARDLTTRACQRAGQKSADIISTVNKDPALPAGTGKQVTTFRCSAAEPQ